MKKIKAPLLLSLTLPVLLAFMPLHEYLNMQKNITYSVMPIFLNAAVYVVETGVFTVAAIEVAKARKTLLIKAYSLVGALFALLTFLLYFLPISLPQALGSILAYLMVSLGYSGIVCVFAYFAILSAYSLKGKENKHEETPQ